MTSINKNDDSVVPGGDNSLQHLSIDLPLTTDDDNESESPPRDQATTFQDPLMENTARLICVQGTWCLEQDIPHKKKLDAIKKFLLNKEDIIVSSFPKSGTTWVQEIVYQIISTRSTGCLTGQKRISLDEDFPYMEANWENIEDIQKRPSPRLIKTHLPYSMLPLDLQSGIGKVIYVARNANDVCVSLYHFSKTWKILNYKGNFEDSFNSFISGKILNGPWTDHVLSYWKHEARENLLFITYEELQKNREAVLERVADFIGLGPLSRDEMDAVLHATSFQVMKNNEQTNKDFLRVAGIFNDGDFMRKGVAGDWRNHMTSEMNDVIEKTCLEPLDPVLRKRLSV